MNGPQKVESPASMVLPSGTIPPNFQTFPIKIHDYTSILWLRTTVTAVMYTVRPVKPTLRVVQCLRLPGRSDTFF